MTARNAWDIAIIGAGPAGLIAAETLAVAGCAVTVYEHRRSPGRKFLLAGRGGLNLTHAEPIEDLLSRYGPARHRLEPAIRAFTPDHLREWCANYGEPTFTGSSGRVFPASFRATPLLRSWLRALDSAGVEIRPGHRWHGWTRDGGLRFLLGDTGDPSAPDELVKFASATIFALGGPTWPRVGSPDTWTDTFLDAGISVEPLEPTNCGVGVRWSPVLRERFEGQPVKNANFGVGGESVRGDAVVTSEGLEGGPIYAHSRSIRHELASRGSAELVLDLAPDLPIDAVTGKLSARRPKASVASWLSSAGFSPLTVALVREVTMNRVPSEPERVAELIKALPLVVDSLAPMDRAISAAGGVRFEAIDDNFMLKSRPGTFIAGEMLDWEAPTGGYLLQACFSTGVAAAQGVLSWLRESDPTN